MEGYCDTCAYGPTQCSRRFDAGANIRYVDGLGIYFDCREWREKEVDENGVVGICTGGFLRSDGGNFWNVPADYFERYKDGETGETVDVTTPLNWSEKAVWIGVGIGLMVWLAMWMMG